VTVSADNAVIADVGAVAVGIGIGGYILVKGKKIAIAGGEVAVVEADASGEITLVDILGGAAVGAIGGSEGDGSDDGDDDDDDDDDDEPSTSTSTTSTTSTSSSTTSSSSTTTSTTSTSSSTTSSSSTATPSPYIILPSSSASQAQLMSLTQYLQQIAQPGSVSSVAKVPIGIAFWRANLTLDQVPQIRQNPTVGSTRHFYPINRSSLPVVLAAFRISTNYRLG
jgi:hypothetical protein